MKNFYLQNSITDEKTDGKSRTVLYSFAQTLSLSLLAFLLIITANTQTRGQLADSFNPNANSSVFAVQLQSDGKVLLGGSFTNVGGRAFGRVGRVNSDGTPDTTFANVNVSDIVYALAIQADGKILIGGTFTTVGGQARGGIARLNTDGTLDTSFNNPVIGNTITTGYYVRSIVLQPDGKILIGGFFRTVSGQTRHHIARLNADGTPDTLFDPNAGENGTVGTVALQPDGKILVGGVFTTIGGAARIRIARLNSDGTVDTTFTSPFTATPNGKPIYAIILQPDGKILAGGNPPNGEPLKAVARLNSDGTPDLVFNQNMEILNGEVRTLAMQSNGKILIGGLFPDMTTKPFRLNADGTKDALYNPNVIGIFAIVVQPDQKILVGGPFTDIAGVFRNCIARLLSDSSRITATKFDFDGDTRADISFFRPSNSTWYIFNSPFSPVSAARTVVLGTATDQLAAADYDGDLKTDIAVFRDGATAYFYILQSQTNTLRTEAFGTTGDVPAVGDWDGDLKADLAVYRNGGNAGAQSYFYYRPTTNANISFRQLAWGATGDKPVVGDYDADGKLDAAVFRPSNGIWYIARSSDNQLQAAQFGLASDKLVAADYDGDNKTDIAVYRDGIWYLQRSQLGFTAIQFGAAGDVPAPADYDGDLKADVTVIRGGTWYLNRSSSGSVGGVYGLAGDVPVPSAAVR